MAPRYSDEFRLDAVRIATTSGLTRPQIASDLGVGVSTLNKWVQKYQHDDLMSGNYPPPCGAGEIVIHDWDESC